MPAPKWLLSIFITTQGTGSVGGGTMRTWLLGLQLLNVLNNVPWHNSSHLKRAIQGSSSAAPALSTHPRHPPVTLAHLSALRETLDLNNTFYAAVFATVTWSFGANATSVKFVLPPCLTPFYMQPRPHDKSLGRWPQTSLTTLSGPCPQKLAPMVKKLDGLTHAAIAVQSGPSKITGKSMPMFPPLAIFLGLRLYQGISCQCISLGFWTDAMRCGYPKASLQPLDIASR